MKRLGIIGGLGPMATAYFLQLIIEMSDAKTDQDHIETIIYNFPKTPDRTKYILGLSELNPAPEMIRIGKLLAEQQVDVLAIPCVTAHYFHAQMEEEIGLPVLHGIRKTAEYLKERNISCVGVMATDGTIQSKLFQTELEAQGIKAVVPDKENQKKVMHLIYDDVKAGKPAEMDLFQEVTEHLMNQGAEVVILGCTELSVIKRDEKLKKGYLDVLDVLARSCVLSCGTLKEEYIELIER